MGDGLMTKKRFTFNVNKNTIEFDRKFKVYVNTVDGFRIANLLNVLHEEKKELIDALNQRTEQCDKLHEENEQLKKEKENWKSSACSNANFNSILLNELSIAQEQGYEVSDPFKRLMNEKGDVE